MYKLTVVSGPNRGSSFAIQQGENWVGRQAGNVVVLQSSKVSKRHCVLVVDNAKILIKDQGSANGTFVNGVLTKRKELRAGDRVSVGDFVLELTRPRQSASRPRALPTVELESRVLQFPAPKDSNGKPVNPIWGSGPVAGVANPNAGMGFGASSAELGSDPHAQSKQMPKDFKGKLIWAFENRLMPIFYELNQKYEWKAICAGLFIVFLFANLFLSVYPTLTASRHAAVKEIGRRASFMAKEIADRNVKALSDRAETRTSIGASESAYGVRVAALTDLDLRIIAPGNRMNDYLTIGDEALWAKRASLRFREGATGTQISAIGDKVIAVEPVLVVNPSLGRNVAIAMAVVSIDTNLLSADIGEIGMVFAETLILTGLVGGFILLILYRLTLRPFQVLNEDMDKVLKGETTQVGREFKFPEMESLWDLINSALQRASSKPAGGDAGDSASGGASLDDLVSMARAMSGFGRNGIAVCDAERRIVMMNDRFEEVSGIRGDQAIGQDFGSVARDQSMGAFMTDLFDRAGMSAGSSEMTAEDYEFSGNSYKVSAWAASGSKGYLLVISSGHSGEGGDG